MSVRIKQHISSVAKYLIIMFLAILLYPVLSTKLLHNASAENTTLDFTNFQYQEYDDYAGGDYFSYGGVLTDDYQGEESTWTSPAANVWKDERTGVYWGPVNTSGTSNNFSLATCDFFTTTPRGSYAGGDSDCGNAINYCATLNFGSRTNWYLPSDKEILMAYVDGMYNKAGVDKAAAAAFTTDSVFWTSTEVATDTNSAWRLDIHTGSNGNHLKTVFYDIRCISRD